MKKILETAFLLAAMLLFASAVQAGEGVKPGGEIELKNGDVIVGKICEDMSTDEFLVVEEMGGGMGGFKKKYRKIPRSEIKTSEKVVRPPEPENMVEVLTQAWGRPEQGGRRTVLAVLFVPFIVPGILLFALSLLLGHRPVEFWKSFVTAFVSWYVPVLIIFSLVSVNERLAFWAAAIVLLGAGWLGAFLLYRERPLRALIFPAVQTVSLALVYFVLKFTIPTT